MRPIGPATLALAVAVAGCATSQPNIKIRQIASAPESYGVGEAEAQLALGNVGLALEGFRSVLRDKPGELRAMIGMAHSYETMNRYDLSRRWYETALATAPDNGAVLAAFADSLERQGHAAEALSVRAEIAANAAAAAQKAQPEPAAEAAAQAGTAPLQSVAAADAAPAPEPMPQLPRRAYAPAPVAVADAPALAVAQVAAPARSVRLTLQPPEEPAPAAEQPAPAPQPADPAEPVLAAASVTMRLPAPVEASKPAAAEVRRAAAALPVEHFAGGPARLERLSLGEVALVTQSKPVWTAMLVKKTPQSVTFRWAEARPVAKLLNAARVEGLAARTRAHLVDRGWRRLEIGDAPAVRAKTVVLYPAFRRGTAQRLASQFGFTELRRYEGSEIVVLLGRDAASLKALRPA